MTEPNEPRGNEEIAERCLGWHKPSEDVLYDIKTALDQKDAIYAKACGGRAYLDEKVMKQDAEIQNLREEVEACRLYFGVPRPAVHINEINQLHSRIKRLEEALRPFAGSYAVNSCGHVDIFPEDLDRAEEALRSEEGTDSMKNPKEA